MDRTKDLSFFLIDLMKSVIRKEDLLNEKADELILQIGKEIDRMKVNNLPTDDIEFLHDTALWLKSEVLGESIHTHWHSP